MEQIPLGEALICVNCNTLFRVPARYCPHCAGDQFVPLGKWLNPKLGDEPAAKRPFTLRRHGWGSGEEAARPSALTGMVGE